MLETQTTNRLIQETSPYLLQHAHNPVDWFPWGDEAFQKAKVEDKPLLLSCGYSACHWCHVMERESFENPEIAALMNQYFVSIKVDREERPDIDQIYQQAVQMITGQGGWPLTVFLDHDRKPFFGGTYFPPMPKYGRTSFPQILQAVHEKWQNEREHLQEASREIIKYMNPVSNKDTQSQLPDPELPIKAAYNLKQAADERYGGFGSAPKFPNAGLLELFLKIGTTHHQNSLIEPILFALEKMARGGIYDQLGGGFHRYSTDQYWLVPHFEKMLYDNAQLLKLYSIGFQLTSSPEFKNVANETSDYIRREMTAPEGGFYATQDADSEGVEGKYFVWDLEEIKQVLDSEEVSLISDYYQPRKEGNFEGKNILNRLKEPEGIFKSPEIASKHWEKLNSAKKKLLMAREKRIKPFRDEKLITGWNGLMIGALAYCYQVFQREEDYQSAKRAANFIINSAKLADGSLSRIFKDGQAKIGAMIDDYAFLAQGLINLYEADFAEVWLSRSLELTKLAQQKFGSDDGLYYLTSDVTGRNLFAKPLSGQDQAIPSGVSVHCENLLRLAAFTGENDLRNEAEKILRAYHNEMLKDSWSYSGLLGASDLFFEDFQEFTCISEESEMPDILMKLRQVYLPNRILTWCNDLKGLASHPAKELLQDRITLNNRPTFYACFNNRCLPPITKWEDLKSILTNESILS